MMHAGWRRASVERDRRASWAGRHFGGTNPGFWSVVRARASSTAWIFCAACLGCESNQAESAGAGVSEGSNPADSTSRHATRDGADRTDRWAPGASTISQDVSTPVPSDEHNGELFPNLAPRLQFEWANSDGGAANSSFIEGYMLLGTLHNLTDASLSVAIHTRGDAGTNRTITLPSMAVELSPNTDMDLQVPLLAFGFDLTAQRYSGRIALKFVIFEEGSSGTPAEYAPPLYFHPEGEGLVVYDENALRNTFHAGDFAGLKTLEPDSDAVITRIVQGTEVYYSEIAPTEQSVKSDGDDSEPPSAEEMAP